MKLQDLQSKETIEFIESLNTLKELITVAFSQRTPLLNGEKYLTVKTSRRASPYQRETAKRLSYARGYPYIKISGKILYKESDILKWLEDNYYG